MLPHQSNHEYAPRNEMKSAYQSYKCNLSLCACVRACVRVCVCACVRGCVCVCVCVCVCARARPCLPACLPACLHARVPACFAFALLCSLGPGAVFHSLPHFSGILCRPGFPFCRWPLRSQSYNNQGIGGQLAAWSSTAVVSIPIPEMNPNDVYMSPLH